MKKQRVVVIFLAFVFGVAAGVLVATVTHAPTSSDRTTVVDEDEPIIQFREGWEQYIDETYDFAIEFPSAFGIRSGDIYTIYNESEAQEGMVAGYLQIYISNITMQQYLANEQILSVEDLEINDVPAKKVEKTLEMFPDARCPEYVLEHNDKLMQIYLYECLDWDLMDEVVNTLQLL